MTANQSANSGEKPVKNSKFIYWLAGWIAILRHPIRVPRDYARAAELLMGDIERVRVK